MKVKVLKTATTPADNGAIEKLLEEAECPVDEILDQEEIDLAAAEELLADDAMEDAAAEELEESGEGLAADDADEDKDVVLVVVLTPECIDDASVTNAVRTTMNGGGQVVGVWPDGSPGGKVPDAIERFGGSAVPWNVERVREAILKGVPMWRNPDDSFRPEKKTKRNC